MRKLLKVIVAAVVLGCSSMAAQARDFVLSVSWQPAFCETKPGKVECQTQTAERFDAANLTLHGLWPQDGQWCQVPAKVKKNDQKKRWKDLPPVQVSAAVRDSLERKMPGTASFLDRHEWTRHGTCAGTSADAYFKTALSLLDGINASTLHNLIANKLGSEIDLDDMEAAVQADYGASGKDAIEFLCTTLNHKQALVEVRYYLTVAAGLPKAVSGQTLKPSARGTSEDQLCDGGKVFVDVAGH